MKEAKALEASQRPFRKLGVLSSYSAEFLRPYILVESDRIDCLLKPWFGPFNQFEQMVLDDNGLLWRENPDVLWITLRIQDVDRYLLDEYAEIDPLELNERIAVLRRRMADLCRVAREQFKGPILASNFTLLDQNPVNVFDASDPDGVTYAIARQNRILAKELARVNDVYLFDYQACIAAHGGDSWCDRRLWYLARMAVAQSAMKPLAQSLVRSVAAVLRPPAKCIVVDLDNTIWGGVVGDDGPSGIKLGDDYPGSVFKDFQAALLGYRRRGFLLAIVSKNNHELACDVIDNHPEMVLRSDHFAAMEISWDPKPINLRRIAEKLNLGLDSFVFLDDNPVERAQVRAVLPMVEVVELPPDPLGYLPALRNVVSLDRPRLLREDQKRADMYSQEAQRKQFHDKHEGIDEFLSGLKMTAKVGCLDPHALDRVHQLIGKTNQFNLTTRRHPLDDIRRFGESERHEVAWLRLRDRFGNLGLVCVGIVKQAEDAIWEIDTFLMSCRVMGRGVEDAFLSYLAELAMEHGAARIRGVYAKTDKNQPVAMFYQDHGFAQIEHPNENTWIFEKELRTNAFPWPSRIERTDS